MNIQEIITDYPDKSFSQVMTDKISGLVSLGGDREQLENYLNQYKDLFSYDKEVQKLVTILKKQEDSEIDNYTGQSILKHIRNIKELRNFAESIDTSDLKNTNNIFNKFDQNIRSKRYNDSISIRAGNEDIPQNIKLVEKYIKDIGDLIKYITHDEIDLTTLENKQKTLNLISKNVEKYEKAINTAENRIKTQGQATGISLQDKATYFSNEAQNHNTKKRKPRLLAGIGTGVLLILIIFIFIFCIPGESIGHVVMRISIAIILSYFIFFSLDQYSNEKRLEESYTFKKLSLQVMDELIKNYSDGGDRDKILDKAIQIIFSEPRLSNKAAARENIINQLIDIIKKKI